MELTVKTEALAGAILMDVCKEAIELAGRIQCRVEFGFNGVTCIAVANSDPDKFSRDIKDSMRSNDKYKIVHS